MPRNCGVFREFSRQYGGLLPFYRRFGRGDGRKLAWLAQGGEREGKGKVRPMDRGGGRVYPYVKS